MDLLTWALLGLLQGVLEWLPVSSTAVVTVIAALLGLNLAEAYNASLLLHVGTLIALMVAFRNDYALLASQAIRTFKGHRLGREARLLLAITVGTALTGLPAYLLTLKVLERASVADAAAYAGAFLAVTAFMAFIARGGKKTSLDSRDAVILGLAQGLAAIPGLSRSGLTISVLMLLGVTPYEAFKWSFLSAGPAIAGVVALELLTGDFMLAPGPLVAVLAAAVVGYVSIGAMLSVARRAPPSLVALLVSIAMFVTALLAYVG